jgi:hypothetical protein
MRSLVNFLIEFFNPDHGSNRMSVVILDPSRPCPQLRELLQAQFFMERVRSQAWCTNALWWSSGVVAAAVLLALWSATHITHRCG